MIHRFSSTRTALSTAVVLVVLFMLQLVGCSRSPEPAVKVSVAVSRTPLSAPFYIAEAKGYFANAGVAVEVVEAIGGHRCLDLVLDGSTDLGTVSDYPVMINSFQRDDYAVVATFVSSHNDVKLVGSRARGVRDPTDLRGKRVGTVTDASSHYFLDRFLLFHGMGLQDVEVIHMQPEEMTRALVAGSVDALSVWEPFGYLAYQTLKEDVIVFANEGYYRETFNLVARNSYATTNGPVIQKVLGALSRATALIRDDPAQAQQILRKRLGLDQAFIDWIWHDFNFGLTLDQSLLVTLETEARWAVEQGIARRQGRKNFLSFVSVDALRALDPTLVNITH